MSAIPKPTEIAYHVGYRDGLKAEKQDWVNHGIEMNKRYQFLKGRFDCATGEAKQSNDESYLNGYGYQYELEAKKDASTDELF